MASSREGISDPRALPSTLYDGRRARSPSSDAGTARMRSLFSPAARAAFTAKSDQLTSPTLARCQMPRSSSISRSRQLWTRSGTYVGETIKSAASATGELLRKALKVVEMKLCESHGPKNALVRIISVFDSADSRVSDSTLVAP